MRYTTRREMEVDVLPGIAKRVTMKGREIDITAQGQKAIDEMQDRVRYPAQVITGMINVAGAECLLEENFPRIEKAAKRAGVWRQLKCAHGSIRAALTKMTEKTSAHQNITLTNNTDGLIICVTRTKKDGLVNLDWKTSNTIASAAMEKCKSCMCTEGEARKCELRQALDACPGVKGDDTGICNCPYMAGEVEEFVDD